MAKITRCIISTYEEEIPEELEAFKKWEFSTGTTTGQECLARLPKLASIFLSKIV